MLGGTASVEALVERASADGLSHLALTDSNALYGAVAFDQACKAANVQPILGMTVNVAPLDDVGSIANDTPGQLVLLATGASGYRSLCALSSLLQGVQNREEQIKRGVTWADLSEYQDGLICLSGGRHGWIERALRAADERTALRYIRRLGGIYEENTYLSLELHRSQDHQIAKSIEALGERFGLPTVAVQPVFCLERAEREKLRLLAAIEQNCPLDQLQPTSLVDGGDSSVELHWLSPDELAARFADFPAALGSIGEITAKCEPAMPDGRPIWPILKLPADQTPDEALMRQAQVGLRGIYEDGEQKIQQRLQHELTIITQHGYAPLFLLVADIVRYARGKQIPVSTRGSVANSLVAYCVGITTVDPIEHDLLFERFLNPERTDPPDIDLDFCSIRRDEVLAYVRKTYGADKVALVATINTMRIKSALRETAKAYGLSEVEIKQLIKLAPSRWHPDPRRRERSGIDEVLAKLDNQRHKMVVAAAFALVGQPHHLSLHPGGLVVTPGPLTDHVPVQWTPKGFLATQFAHEDVEAIGLPKVDLLGIRALTVLATATDLVQEHYDAEFSLEAIAFDDNATSAILETGDTVGVFQCESSGAQRTLRQLKARKVYDLAVANAFFKPGPATGGMAGAFIQRYRGEETVAFLHPTLEPILGSTQGVLIFQEQILRIAHEIAGLSWGEADHLRRGMSKFKPEQMEAMRSRFIKGCSRPAPAGPAFTAKDAETLWEQVRAFAGYGFNQGHATAYADVSYRSAFIKAHWPAAFLAARLANWGGFHHPAIYMAEAMRLGIPVRPPHVNQSNRHFTLTFEDADPQRASDVVVSSAKRPTLWMGLGQVRDLRRASVQAIVEERQRAPFQNVRDLMTRVSLQKKEMLHLIQCGSLDGLCENRAAGIDEAEVILRTGSSQQMTFGFLEPTVAAETVAQRLVWEEKILGQPLSTHPIANLGLALDDQTLDDQTLDDQTVGGPSLEGLVSLTEVRSMRAKRVEVACIRLPGWTGGKGYFIGDGFDYLIAQAAEGSTNPKAWQPLRVSGRWVTDSWGGGKLMVEEVESF